MRKSSVLFLGLVVGCSDPAGQIEGVYNGSLNSPALISTSYTLTLTALDRTTVEVAPDAGEFDAFEVDVLFVGGTVTSEPGSPAELGWTDGTLSVNNAEIQFGGEFSGALVASVDPDPPGTDGTAAQTAAGTYTGLIAGPVNSVDHEVSIVVVDGGTISVRGAGFDTFEVPIGFGGNGVEATSVWNEGAFDLDGDSLEFSHDVQSLTFQGSR